MKSKVITGIILTVLLIGMLTLAFNIQPLRSVENLCFKKASSGKIAYDTFSASNGTATDIPWIIMEDSELGIAGNWTVENGTFKSVSLSSCTAEAYPRDVNVIDFVWEAKVKPMHLTGEGPEIDIGDLPINACSLEAVFDYFNSINVLRIMISSSPPPPPTHSTYQMASFVMNEGVWYTMKVAVSGSNMKCFVDNVLKFDVIDSNLGTAPPRMLRHQGYYDGEWGYWDDVKIWKSNTITVINLAQGQKVELINTSDNLVSSATVGVGENNTTLDVSPLSFPFEGYFKIYASDGNSLLYTSAIYDDIWGGDEYQFSTPSQPLTIDPFLSILIVGLVVIVVVVAILLAYAVTRKKKRPSAPTRICPQCGRELPPNFKFCPYCGKTLGE